MCSCRRFVHYPTRQTYPARAARHTECCVHQGGSDGRPDSQAGIDRSSRLCLVELVFIATGCSMFTNSCVHVFWSIRNAQSGISDVVPSFEQPCEHICWCSCCTAKILQALQFQSFKFKCFKDVHSKICCSCVIENINNVTSCEHHTVVLQSDMKMIDTDLPVFSIMYPANCSLNTVSQLGYYTSGAGVCLMQLICILLILIMIIVKVAWYINCQPFMHL